jgi:hypothetical protein
VFVAKLCEFAISGLAHLLSLRICESRINHKKVADLRTACYSQMSPIIFGVVVCGLIHKFAGPPLHGNKYS